MVCDYIDAYQVSMHYITLALMAKCISNTNNIGNNAHF